jgi:3-hydroxybutyryl-CoA dehydrogenase
MREIKNITIVGAGTLGSRIGFQAAISGYTVMLYDIREESFAKAKTFFQKITHQLQKAGKLSEDVEKIVARISFTTNLKDALSDCDLISESVLEDINVKQKVWEEIGTLAPAKTIFTTNTSFLTPSQLAAATGRPKQFCAFHFHDVFYARIVDIMPHPKTDPELIPLLEKLGRKLNQVPVVIHKESEGYLFNFMLMALIGAAGKLKTKGIAEIEAIDKSWMVNFNSPSGPFGIIDTIGLDTAWLVVKARQDDASQKFASLLKSYIDQGKLGEKTGEGFYRYPNPAFRHPEFLK